MTVEQIFQIGSKYFGKIYSGGGEPILGVQIKCDTSLGGGPNFSEGVHILQ